MDLSQLENIRSLWAEVVDPALAVRCIPVLLKGDTLVIEVPSGVYAQRLREDTEIILAEFSRRGVASVMNISPIVRESPTT
ncbi:MAG: DUF721 domain-containing protein [Acidimicrobiaceae bacterium]|nr:DUF721 domain-containing protein [Acidimicrobiaceae bacterium]